MADVQSESKGHVVVGQCSGWEQGGACDKPPKIEISCQAHGADAITVYCNEHVHEAIGCITALTHNPAVQSLKVKYDGFEERRYGRGQNTNEVEGSE